MLLRLAENANVLLHNYRPQAARRLGMSYETFRAVNPGIVYVGTYGFRATGPYGDKPAYDDIIQAASGIASLQASIVGEPRYVPTIVADKSSSMTVLAAVLAALYHQARTGEGQEVEVPMFESMAAWVMVEHLYGETLRAAARHHRLQADPQPEPRARSRRRTATWRSSPTPIRTGATSSPLTGRQDLLDDPRYKTLGTRLRHIEILYAELAKIALTRTNAEWLAELDRLNIPAMTVNTLEALLHDPHLEAVGFWQTVEHPSEGTLRLPGIPATYGKTPGRHPAAAAARWASTAWRCCARPGSSAAEIDALLATGATRSESSKGVSQ